MGGVIECYYSMVVFGSPNIKGTSLIYEGTSLIYDETSLIYEGTSLTYEVNEVNINRFV